MVRPWIVWIYMQEVVEHFTEKEVETDSGMPQMDNKWVQIFKGNSEQLKKFYVFLIFVGFFSFVLSCFWIEQWQGKQC